MPLFAAAALLTLAATPLLARYARRQGLIDKPDPRRLHVGEVVRGAGAAMVGAFLLCTAVGPWLAPDLMTRPLTLPAGLYVAVLGALGFWDDHQPIAARWRASIQLVATVGLLLALPLPEGALAPPLVAVAGVLLIVWWINLFNFMDGSNGMAAVQALFMGLAASWLVAESAVGGTEAYHARLCALLTAGVAAGFLPWNFPRPRAFMGDVGSYGLAAMLTVTALLGLRSASLQWAEVLLLPAVFVLDASLTLLRRVLARRRWYDAHREHVYQRLAAGGVGAAGVLMIYTVVNAGFILPAVWFQRRNPELSTLTVFVVYGLLIAAWLIVSRALDRRQGT
ncbi:MAG: hypothetical protein AAF358_09075 [Pseudomonadota bacterium]